jgi:hypothetical protein
MWHFVKNSLTYARANHNRAQAKTPRDSSDSAGFGAGAAKYNLAIPTFLVAGGHLRCLFQRAGRPISAPGRNAAPWQERIVTIGFVSVGVVIIAATVLILVGLRRNGRE